jgi:class 3 adenylate cyclase
VNSGITRILGFSPEQLLGQLIEVILAEESKERFVQGLESARQGGGIFAGELSCLTDHHEEVLCRISVVALDQERNLITLDNIAILNERRALAMGTREQCDRLVESLIPKEFSALVETDGHKGGAVGVNAASVMFMEIMDLDHIAAAVSPSEFMATIGALFRVVDDVAQQFDNITPVRVVANQYFCAAGLFTANEAKSGRDIVGFALRCLEEVGELRPNLPVEINVRIGISTGGPIAIGAIGSTGLHFDVIGEPIGVAQQLTQVAPPSGIVISAETYACNLVHGIQAVPMQCGRLRGYIVGSAGPFGMSNSKLVPD